MLRLQEGGESLGVGGNVGAAIPFPPLGTLGIGFAPVGWGYFAVLPPKPPEKGGGDGPPGVHVPPC